MYENNIEDIISAQNGQEDKMSKLVERNSGLIWNIVKRFYNRGYEKEDLYQIGTIGFIKAIQRFDTRYEVQLSTYAVPYILGEIKRFIRDDGPVKISRNMKELTYKIREIQKQWEQKGKEIGIYQLSEILKVPKEEIAMALDSAKPIESIYEEGKDDNLRILDKLACSQDESELIANRLSIQELIQNLEEKEKEIIVLRYYKQKTQMQVAKIIGISQVQVSRIEKKILSQMKCKLIG